MSDDRVSFRRMGRDTLIYGVGMMLSRAVSFFMLPVYTRYLTTSDYGIVNLLDMTIDISYILFTAGMSAGMSLFYFQAKSDQERDDVVITSYALEMGLTVLGTLALLLASPWVWRYGLKGAGTVLFVRITAVNFALQMLTAVPLVLLQTRQRPHAVITINLVRLVIQLSLNILFVVVLRKGVLGILVTGLIVNALQGFAMMVWLLREVPGRVRLDIIRQLRKFGLPFQISRAGSFVLAFGDRFFLQASRGASAVGIYGLAYQFGFLLNQLSTEQILKAWNPQRLQMLEDPRDVRDERFDRGFHYFNLVLFTVATGIGIFIKPVIAVMTTAPFHPAAALVPIILAAYVVQGWDKVLQFGIGVSRQTKYIGYSTWIGLVVVLILYATLIPRWGGFGAAVATLVAFIVRAVAGYYWSQRLWPVSYRWGPNLRLAGYSTALVLTGFIVPAQGIAEQLALGLALLATYSALTWFTFLKPDDRLLLKTLVRSPRQLRTLMRASAG
jgi:O-antigen/teichoic acid export membrane protein